MARPPKSRSRICTFDHPIGVYPGFTGSMEHIPRQADAKIVRGSDNNHSGAFVATTLPELDSNYTDERTRTHNQTRIYKNT